ncbi:MAG: transposase, partial [Nitrospirae bacterium]|nr:transposase [Nitrospirota bacterium]
MGQRRWSAEEKFSIVIEGIKNNRSVADICREHKLSDNGSQPTSTSFMRDMKTLDI